METTTDLIIYGDVVEMAPYAPAPASIGRGGMWTVQETAYDRYARFFGFMKAKQKVMDHIRMLPSDDRTRSRQLTRKSYHQSLKEFIHFLRDRRVLPDEDTIMSYIAALKNKGIQAKTIGKKMAVVRLYCKALGNQGLRLDLTENERDMTALIYIQNRIKAAVEVQNPKLEQSSEMGALYNFGKRMTLLQANILLESIERVDRDGRVRLDGLRDYAIFMTALYGWVRVNELAHISLDKIQMMGDNRVIRIFGKRSKERFVSIPESVYRAIMEWVNAYREAGGVLENDEPIWKNLTRSPKNPKPSKKNSPLSNRSIFDLIQRRSRQGLKAFGIFVSPHDLRRTGAALAHMAGMPIEYIQAQLGHKSLDMTMRYIGQLPNFKARNLAEYGIVLG